MDKSTNQIKPIFSYTAELHIVMFTVLLERLFMSSFIDTIRKVYW